MIYETDKRTGQDRTLVVPELATLWQLKICMTVEGSPVVFRAVYLAHVVYSLFRLRLCSVSTALLYSHFVFAVYTQLLSGTYGCVPIALTFVHSSIIFE